MDSGGGYAYRLVMSIQPSDSILIIDFGSQVTQLIARRVREAGVYSEIAPFNAAQAAFERMQPKGIILSGGPASTTEAGSPRTPQCVFDSGLPILGICYGQQTMMMQLGGHVTGGEGGEFGRAFIEVEKPCALFDGVWPEGEKHQVWMSHGDKVTAPCPGLRSCRAPAKAHRMLSSPTRPGAIYACSSTPRWCTRRWRKALQLRAHNICGLPGDWTMAAFRATKIVEIRAQVGKGRVICGLSAASIPRSPPS
jgi:GMP synthase (glutamine-hydrolysing)